MAMFDRLPKRDLAILSLDKTAPPDSGLGCTDRSNSPDTELSRERCLWHLRLRSSPYSFIVSWVRCDDRSIYDGVEHGKLKEVSGGFSLY